MVSQLDQLRPAWSFKQQQQKKTSLNLFFSAGIFIINICANNEITNNYLLAT